ncbi:MAG: phosphoribosylglycinamide formyltransferase [Planctomycetes bacterium]|nr:phosphoribosylglycinamide formyltransferase [Planctomycetota bacterium]
MPARLGILLSGGGSTYANLEAAIADGRLAAEIAVVVSSRADAGGLAIAAAHGRPAMVASDAAAVTAALHAHRAQWVAMCGWMRYWDPPADFAGRVVNIHPSLLPRFGGKGMYGAHVHRAVLAAGSACSGCTVHLVSGDYDSGQIVAQSEVPVLPGDTVEALQARVQAAERELFPKALAGLLAGG